MEATSEELIRRAGLSSEAADAPHNLNLLTVAFSAIAHSSFRRSAAIASRGTVERGFLDGCTRSRWQGIGSTFAVFSIRSRPPCCVTVGYDARHLNFTAPLLAAY
jgi:hypothetical protein